MTNITTTSTVLDQTTDAAFRTWVAEIITALTSTLTLVQTTDTGQINTSTVTRAAINTAAGYSIFRYSDTLQSTSPVFIKLEYGSGGANTLPQMWITLGQGSNGSGTLTGNLTQRCAANSGAAATSLTTSYTSRFIVNMTLGYVGLAWKIGSQGTNVGSGAFMIFRSNDSSGAPTGDSINLITNNVSVTGSASQTGQYVGYSYLTSSQVPPGVLSAASSGSWLGASHNAGYPFGLTSSAFSGNSYTVPVYYLTPVPSISAYNCCALDAEVPVGTTISEAVVGATALTFVSVGRPWGAGNLGVIGTTTTGFCMLWQ